MKRPHRAWAITAGPPKRRWPSSKPPIRPRTPALLDRAAEAVWAFLIQREFCGMKDHTFIIREMHIPKAVLNRMGAMKRKPGK